MLSVGSNLCSYELENVYVKSPIQLKYPLKNIPTNLISTPLSFVTSHNNLIKNHPTLGLLTTRCHKTNADERGKKIITRRPKYICAGDEIQNLLRK